MKYLLIMLGVLVAGNVSAAPVDKTIFSTLDAGQSKTYELTVPKGKTSIYVEQTTDTAKPVLSCVFSNGSGDVGLEQLKVEQCVGKLVLADENKIVLKVTNESSKILDIKVKQFTVKK